MKKITLAAILAATLATSAHAVTTEELQAGIKRYESARATANATCSANVVSAACIAAQRTVLSMMHEMAPTTSQYCRERYTKDRCDKFDQEQAETAKKAAAAISKMQDARAQLGLR
jgi:hypothetical protein